MHYIMSGRSSQVTQVTAVTTGNMEVTFKLLHPLVASVDREISVDDLFRRKLNTRNILRNVRRPIPILVAKVWQRNLDYAKN